MKTSDISDTAVLLACEYARSHGFASCNGSLGRLVDVTGAPEKVAWRALERADNRGLIEYGTSLRCAWPTPKGEAMLRELGNLF